MKRHIKASALLMSILMAIMSFEVGLYYYPLPAVIIVGAVGVILLLSQLYSICLLVFTK